MHFLSREEPAPISGRDHLIIMAVGSLVAALASAALMWSGARTRDARAVIAGGAFAAMTLLMGFHGLATPGVILGPNGLVPLAGGAALPVGAALLALAAVPELRRPARLRYIVTGLVLFLSAIIAAGTAALGWPERGPTPPPDGRRDADALMLPGLRVYALLLPPGLRPDGPAPPPAR